MEKIFYAVQHGDCYDWDIGSPDYDLAVRIAKDMTLDPDYIGEEIRIATIDEDANCCIDVEVIAEEVSEYALSLYERGIPAGSEYRADCETLYAPSEPGTYRLMSEYRIGTNIHTGWVWEKEGEEE